MSAVGHEELIKLQQDYEATVKEANEYTAAAKAADEKAAKIQLSIDKKKKDQAAKAEADAKAADRAAAVQRVLQATNHYDVLGVSADVLGVSADADKLLTNARKTLLLKIHPDKHNNSEDANDACRRVNESYKALLEDIEKRAAEAAEAERMAAAEAERMAAAEAERMAAAEVERMAAAEAERMAAAEAERMAAAEAERMAAAEAERMAAIEAIEAAAQASKAKKRARKRWNRDEENMLRQWVRRSANDKGWDNIDWTFVAFSMKKSGYPERDNNQMCRCKWERMGASSRPRMQEENRELAAGSDDSNM